MKKQLAILIMFLFSFVFTGGAIYASDDDNGSIYGHISYVEGTPKVIRADQTQEGAVVNLPVAPGDVLLTDDTSRCELQFDNGTIMRLDKNSKLIVTTVLAKSLTSKWKITTLELQKGKLYSINQSYNLECFQIITPNSALRLKNNSIITIMLKEGTTHLACDRGKFQVLYGGEVKNLKAETVRNGEGYIVTADNMLIKNDKRDIDFLAWNEYINNNFKKFHYGISKVPKKLYRYSKGLVTWAEKWSSLVGEWIYDDLFGYVWKPLDPRYAHQGRLFINASHTTVNGQTFLVPNEPWGWVPAHMGTWVWMKWGWTWVPGNAFTPNRGWYTFTDFSYPFYYSSIYYWMDKIYGGVDYYYSYRNQGIDHWRSAYQARFNKTAPKPSYKDVPKEIQAIFKKMDRTPVSNIQTRLGKLSPEIEQALSKAPIKETMPIKQEGNLEKLIEASPTKIINTLRYSYMTKDNSPKDARIYRDWNPDKQWAYRNGVSVGYSSKHNEVVCPTLGLRSNQITSRQIQALTTGSRWSGGYGGITPLNTVSGSYDSPAGISNNPGSRSESPASFSSSKGGDPGSKALEKQ